MSTRTPPASTQNLTAPIPVINSAIKIVIKTVIYLTLLTLVSLALIVGTPIGSRVAVMLADHLVPNLNVDYLEGTLNDTIMLKTAKWHMDGVQVSVTDLYLNWEPTCLFNKRICVNQLQASSVNVKVTTDSNHVADDNANSHISKHSEQHSPNQNHSEQDEHHQSQQFFSLPFSINLIDSELSHINVKVNDMEFTADKLQLAADWPQKIINVSQLVTQGLKVNIPFDASSADNNTSTNVHHNWPIAHLPKAFNPVPVKVVHLIMTDSLLQLGQRQDHFADISLAGEYIGTHIQVDSLSAAHDIGKLKMQGDLTLDYHYPINLAVVAELNANRLVNGLEQQQVSLNAKGDFTDLKLNSRGQGDTEFTLDITANLTKSTTPFVLNLTSTDLRWPLLTPEYTASNATIQIQGDRSGQSVRMSGEITTPFYPQAQLSTELSHHNHTITVPHLQIISDDSSLHLNGQVNYQGSNISDLNWELDINANQINPANIKLPTQYQLPIGLISAKLTTSGMFNDKQWQVGISSQSLEGELNGYPLQLTGDMKINDQGMINAKHLELSALGSSLTAHGNADNNWDLNGKLIIPDLSLWMADLQGSVNAELAITGNSAQPKLNLDGQILDINIKGAAIEQMNIKANLALTTDHAYDLAINSTEIKFKQTTITSLSLISDGNINKQQFALQTDGDIRLNTQLDNLYEPSSKAFQAVFNQLNIDGLFGDWLLNKPIQLSGDLNKYHGSVSDFCLENKHGQLCLDDNLTVDNKGDAQLSFKGDIGAIVAPLLPQQINWQAPTELTASLNWQPKSKPIATTSLTFKPGRLTVTRRQQPPKSISYQGGSIVSSLNEQHLTINTHLDAGELASISSNVQINVANDRSIAGDLTVAHLQLQGLQIFMPQINTLTGDVTSKINISGSLSQPKLNGKFQLKQGSLAATANPTLIENIDLTLDFADQQVDVQGEWAMGQGQAKLTGNLDWHHAKPSGSFSLTGDKLEVIAPPIAIVEVSPDLTLNFSPSHTHISGNIHVPGGEVKIVQMPPGGIPLSSDVVFEDSIAANQSHNKPYPISLDLNLDLDNKVKISGMGLTGNLAGTLTFQQAIDGPPLLFGEVQVVNGSYRFLGQRLTISAGELQFVGSANNPNLNIEAVRVIKNDDGEVTAGIRVTGSPNKPIVKLFSNPAMEQAGILLYIIKGSGINDAEQSDALMMSAALTLSSQLADGAFGNLGSVTTKLAEKLGISDIQLETNDHGKVAISGFIGDRLMVKYGIGVFNPGYELTVRYYLLTRLYLEAISGSLDQSLDLYYSFDLD